MENKTLRRDLIEKGIQSISLLNDYKKASVDISMIQRIVILEEVSLINKYLEEDSYIIIGATHNTKTIQYHLGYVPEIARARKIEQDNLQRIENIFKAIRENEQENSNSLKAKQNNLS